MCGQAMLRCTDAEMQCQDGTPRHMRTTLEIDDDLLAAAKELSRQQGRTAGAVISALLRQALTGMPPGGDATNARRSRQAPALGGFRPFVSRGMPVTNDAIDALRDDGA